MISALPIRKGRHCHCSGCGFPYKVNKNGKIPRHKEYRSVCPGSGKLCLELGAQPIFADLEWQLSMYSANPQSSHAEVQVRLLTMRIDTLRNSTEVCQKYTWVLEK